LQQLSVPLHPEPPSNTSISPKLTELDEVQVQLYKLLETEDKMSKLEDQIGELKAKIEKMQKEKEEEERQKVIREQEITQLRAACERISENRKSQEQILARPITQSEAETQIEQDGNGLQQGGKSQELIRNNRNNSVEMQIPVGVIEKERKQLQQQVKSLKSKVITPAQARLLKIFVIITIVFFFLVDLLLNMRIPVVTRPLLWSASYLDSLLRPDIIPS